MQTMFSFHALVLSLLLTRTEAAWQPFRSLSERAIAGFEPKTDVTDHANIDKDQQAIEKYLDGLSIQSFQYARDVFEKGGYSKSVATLTLDSGLGVNLNKGTRITGSSSTGSEVSLVAYDDSSSGAVRIDVQYTDPNACNVGGLLAPAQIPDPFDVNLSGDQNWVGCLAQSGTIVIGGTPVTYSYSIPNDNRNERTIAGFSTSANMRMRPDQNDDPFFPDFQKFLDYYGATDYASKWVDAALSGQATSFANGNADFTKYEGDYTARAEAVKKGSSYMAVAMYVIRELEDAIYDCEQGCDTDDCNDDAVHALDEAVAFYTGSAEGTTGLGSGYFMYALADKRAANFKTANDDGKAGINSKIFREFALMQDNLTNKQCEAARKNKERIAQLMWVPLVQGTLRYAFSTGTADYDTKGEAEGATFAASVLPIVHACNPQDAQTIYDNMKVGQGGTADFGAVKKAFENNYMCMGINCADVGGIWSDGLQTYEEGAEPCVGGASGALSFGVNTMLAVGLSIAGLLLV